MIIDNKVTDHVNYLSHLKNELTSIAIANTVLFYGSHSGISSHVLCRVLFVATNSKCHNIFLKSCMLFFFIQESVFIQTKSVHPQPSLQQRFTKTLSLTLFTLTSALNISPRAVNPESCSWTWCHSKNFFSLYFSSLVTTCATKNPCWALRLTHSV